MFFDSHLDAAARQLVAQAAQPVLRVDRVLGTAGKADLAMAEAGEVCRHGRPRRDVVAAHHLHVGRDLVRGDDHRRQLRFDRRLEQRPFAALGLGEDQAVDAAIANPGEDQRRVVLAAQLEAGEHQAGVARRQLLLDPHEQLHEPGVRARVDRHADTAAPAETEVARRPGSRIPERGDDFRQPRLHRRADVVAVEVTGDRADGHARVLGDGGDGGLFHSC